MTTLSEITLADWAYETDYRLTHVGGLKVDFADAHFDRDPATRAKALGDYVVGTVHDSRRRAQAHGATEIDAVEETRRLLSQARLLYRVLPAGTEGAPRSLKRDRLRSLVERRRQDRWDPYRCIGDFHGGKYESDHVSPFTKAASNLDSPIVILLLDWASSANLRRFDQHTCDHGYSENEPTTERLQELLERHFGLRLDEVYATNLFPFVRDQLIRSADLRRAALEYAIPQIDIVAPRLVICLGGDTFNALRQASGLPAVKNLDEGLKKPFGVGECGARVWSQSHTGYWGQKRGAERVAADWRAMVAWFQNGRREVDDPQ